MGNIREATDADTPGVLNMIHAAFGEEGDEIAELITNMLADPTAEPRLSLVAVEGERVVGHILFTRAELEGSTTPVSATILAPLAVHPDVQNRGIGGALINEGLNRLRQMNVELVFVLGHPGYYPRYGFTPAGVLGYAATYEIAPKNADAWMVQELQPGVIERTAGRVNCARSLDEERYWVG